VDTCDLDPAWFEHRFCTYFDGVNILPKFHEIPSRGVKVKRAKQNPDALNLKHTWTD
jgi:hypothetical protein